MSLSELLYTFIVLLPMLTLMILVLTGKFKKTK